LCIILTKKKLCMTFITVSSLSPQIHAASRVLLFKHRLKIMFLYWSLLKLIVMI